MLSADSFFLADAIGRVQGLDAWECLGLAAAIESTENAGAVTTGDSTDGYEDDSEGQSGCIVKSDLGESSYERRECDYTP